jgi:hypothetical protein
MRYDDNTRVKPDQLNRNLMLGNSLWLYYGPDNSSNHVRHIRAIVDRTYIVTRRWLYSKQRWQYDIESFVFYQVAARYGTLYSALNKK